MDHDITQIQNTEPALRLLAAQRCLYNRAKTIQRFQIAFSVLIPGTLLLIEVYTPSFKAWAALVGLTIAILDIALLEQLKKSFKNRAATVQEQFDCKVLSLPLPDFNSVKPDPEDVQALSSGFQASDLRDWYPKEVSALALQIARIICQRSNCWWDSKLRRTYRMGLISLLILTCASLVVWAMVMKLTVGDFVLSFMAPVLPFVLWSIREIQEQAEAAKRADELKSFGDDLWRSILAKKLTMDKATIRSRVFQDGILEHRQRSPIVFDWVYWLLKSKFENQMQYGASEMINEAKRIGF